jgi:hypothetical protein
VLGIGAAPYYHFTLARTAALLGLRDCDGVNWYAAGVRHLLERQGADGAWPAPASADAPSGVDVLPTVWNTAFLVRATLPEIPAGDRELR